MRQFLTLAALILGGASAQSQVVLSLPTPSAIADAPAFVARVVDLRADTSTVGEAKVGLTNRRRPVVLAGGTVAAVGDFVRAALPTAPGKEPLVVGIDVLSVSERTTATTEFGSARVQLRWFREDADGLVEVARTQGFAEGRGMDVTAGHEDRLAAALRQAAQQLLTEDLSTPRDAESLALDAIPRSSESATAALTSPADASGPSFRTTVSGGAIIGGNATGGRIAVGLRPVTDAAWSFPLVFELAVLKTDDGTGREGVFSTYGGMFQASRRLGTSTAFLQPGIQITGGTETENSDNRFFFGGRLSLDLVRYPAEKGLVAGLGVYGSRLFGSEVYPRDVGVSVTLGGQF